MKNRKKMKGIILAGGSGSRLYPLTKVASKQLQAVYDKPMIYYPLTTLMAAGIDDICIVTTPHDTQRFQSLLHSGQQWGIKLTFLEQKCPSGIADALLLTEEFVGRSNFAIILGDNIFSGGSDIPNAIDEFEKGATIFAYHVPLPTRYGVVEFNQDMQAISLEEKPLRPKSNFAITGLYLYDHTAFSLAKSLVPSSRGELEITDLNVKFLNANELKVHRLSRGYAWLDSGNSESLHDASNYIAAIEKRQGIKIGCPEEAALVRGFVKAKDLMKDIQQMPECDYKNYIKRVAEDFEKGEF